VTDAARLRALDDRFAFLEDPSTQVIPGSGTGPLAGLRIGVKSNIAVAGQAWTAGIAGRGEVLAEADAEVIARLRAAGADLLPGLTMDEAALGAATETSGLRATQNPFAPGHSVGGSSGGAAAAVACGAVPVALGSDTLGSVRIPAAYCGVLGFKPGAGVLPLGGVVPLDPALDTLGLLARRVADLRAVYAVLAPEAVAETAQVVQLAPQADVACAPEVQTALARAARLLDASGPDRLEGWEAEALRMAAFTRVCAAAATTLADQPIASVAVRSAMAYGARLTPDGLARAEALCDRVAAALRARLPPGTVALTPTTPTPAFARGTPPPADQASFTVLANLAGLPAISVPMGPASVQLMAGPGQEGTLLALADRLSAA
jgi:aspartyl-tRNA(Asn)/glutamyl-tRNA(Gln) amidotransferase subunit A